MYFYKSKDDDDDNESYISKSIKAALLLAVVSYFFAWAIPISTSYIWTIKGTVND
jgi:hypothetical protein